MDLVDIDIAHASLCFPCSLGLFNRGSEKFTDRFLFGLRAKYNKHLFWKLSEISAVVSEIFGSILAFGTDVEAELLTFSFQGKGPSIYLKRYKLMTKGCTSTNSNKETPGSLQEDIYNKWRLQNVKAFCILPDASLLVTAFTL